MRSRLPSFPAGFASTFASKLLALSTSFDGTDASYAFDQEQPDQLWVGRRDDNRIVLHDPNNLADAARRLARLPAGHPQGYQDAFSAFVADVYAAVRGQMPDGMPTFQDGLRAASSQRLS